MQCCQVGRNIANWAIFKSLLEDENLAGYYPLLGYFFTSYLLVFADILATLSLWLLIAGILDIYFCYSRVNDNFVLRF